MRGKWRELYFDRVESAMSVGSVGETALKRLNPTSFVLADVLDTASWSVVVGCGSVLLHVAVTRGGAPQDTIIVGAGSVGVALLLPVLKDGIVSVLADVGELLERRHMTPAQPELSNEPIPPVMVKTAENTWKFYTPPVRKSDELVPARCVRAVARRAMNEGFTNFSERHFAGELNVISGPDFRLFQADLVKRGWASKGANNRVKIEPAGRAMLIKLATT